MIDTRFFKKRPPFSLEALCTLTKTTPTSKDPALEIANVASLEEAGPADVACFHNSKYLEAFKTSRAGFCFVEEAFVPKAPSTMVCLVTPSPYRAFGQAALALYPEVDRAIEVPDTLLHPTAKIGADCRIGPGALLHRDVEVGAGTFIGANSVIGPGVQIGQGCYIDAHVTLSHTLIGNKVTIFPGVRIGQAGFGFFMDQLGHVKVPQLGRVLIGDDVEIGANTTIDRGSLKDTLIGEGCRLDNLVQIAHNVELGKGCVLVAQVGIAGSTRLGDFVVVGGQAGLSGHLTIGKGVRIAAQSGVMKDSAAGTTVGGSPAVPIRDWHRQTALLSKFVKDSKSKRTSL